MSGRKKQRNKAKKLRQLQKKKEKKIVSQAKAVLEEEANTKYPSKTGFKDIDELVKLGNKMWKKVKDTVKKTPEFMEYPDKKKLSYFRDELDYDEFMNEFPVMTRYMICMGQYSSKAFRKFLDKVKMTKHPPPEERAKGYMEDQWVRRQSDYVAYLWESYQKGHPNRSDRNNVWQDAYKNLKGEFDDFRDKYKDLEKKTKKEKKTLNATNARELLQRLRDSNQSLSEEDATSLNEYLKNTLYKRRYKNTIADMMKVVPKLAPVCQGRGKGPEEEERPHMTTIIHADEEQVNAQNIPDHYRLNTNSVAGLPIVKE